MNNHSMQLPLPAALAVLPGLLLPGAVQAATPVQVDVTYSGCYIVEGPLTLGLAALPESIDARFVFLAETWPPPLDTSFDPGAAT